MARNKTPKPNGGATVNDDQVLQQYVDTDGHFSMVRYGIPFTLLCRSMLSQP